MHNFTPKIRNLIQIALILFAGHLPAGPPPEGIPVRYVTSWDGSGPGFDGFRNPEGLDVDPAGRIYVADTGNHRLVELSNSGEPVAGIGGFGWEAEQFDRPVSLCASNGLDVLVADFQNHRIQRYDKDLHYLAAFNTSPDWPEMLQFGYPLDVALSPQGELLCLDGENHRVLKLDITGTPQLSFGDYDAGAGRLNDPRRLAVDAGGRVYVSDASGIVLFDALGNYLMTFGGSVLDDPRDLCLIGDMILVADAGNRCVQVFRSPGKYWGKIEIPPINGQRFEEPVAVACVKKTVLVIDSRRSSLDVFQWTGR